MAGDETRPRPDARFRSGLIDLIELDLLWIAGNLYSESVNNRRHFLSFLAALAAAPAPPADAAQPRTHTAGVYPLPAPFDKRSATLIEVYCAPGEPTAAHRHPGFVLGYVIEGEFRFQIAGQPERTLRAGETFYEPPGAKHLVSASASPDKPARILAIIIAEPEKPLVERL